MVARGSLRLRAGVLALPLAASLVGGSLPVNAQSAPQTVPGVCADDEERQFLDSLNAYRAEQGLGSLALSQTLSEAAEFQSADMGAKGYFAHTMADGTSVEQKLRNFGYTDSTFGENILAGTETGSEALRTWQSSASHDANMRRDVFRAIGIARVYNEASPYGWYWTTIFGGTLDEEGVVCGEERGSRKRAMVNDPDVNLRSGPGLDFRIADVLQEGDEVTVTGAVEGGYLPVEIGETHGWVAAEWLDVNDTLANDAPAGATVTETVNLREQPSRESAVLTIVPGGSAIDLTGRTADGYVEGTWDGTTGWIDAAYVAGSATAPAAQPADPPTANPDLGPAGTATATTAVNIRATPSRSASVVAVVPAGEVVDLTGKRAEGYLSVSFDGAVGWIDSAYLQ